MDDLKIAIKQAKDEFDRAYIKWNTLMGSCTHEIIKRNSSGYCSICGIYKGWWCPNSPTSTCDYNQEDGFIDEDSCRYCGKPEERK